MTFVEVVWTTVDQDPTKNIVTAIASALSRSLCNAPGKRKQRDTKAETRNPAHCGNLKPLPFSGSAELSVLFHTE